jgi:hypothetical protein
MIFGIFVSVAVAVLEPIKRSAMPYTWRRAMRRSA